MMTIQAVRKDLNESVIISRAKNDLMTFLNLSAITKLSIWSNATMSQCKMRP